VGSPAASGDSVKGQIMIIWIAGAPHNGSTLLRQILKQCFEISSFSRYNEPELEFMFPGGANFTKLYRQNEVVRLQWLCGLPQTTFIKTHELPLTASPAIFVVRDGRDAITALSHFWQMPRDHAIAGQGSVFADWSSYFYAWDPLNRPNTILVRFEDMVGDANKVVREQLAPFLGVEPKADFVDEFEENQKKFPQLFQDSGSCWQDEMTEADLDLFWKCHGEVMGILGYDDRETADVAS
jgi:hypothetical protein